ncbi:MAG: 6-carboxytetrahydropterin synthase QueD [Candidatus Omnitrophota bacterium]
MYELTVKGEFAASHSLRDYEGKCKNLHGHTWHVDIVVAGATLNKVGMLVDFKEIKSHLHELLESLDHAHLNDLAYFKKVNPTSENIAKYIFDCFKEKPHTTIVKKVTVWESEKSGATYYEG